MSFRLPAFARLRPARIALVGAVACLACAGAHAGSLEILSAATPGAPGTEFTVKTQVLLIMTLLGLLPVLAMMTTSFTRFVIVLSLLRQALGLQQGLPNRVVTGVALILTMLVMRPVGQQIWNEAFVPFDQDKIGLELALKTAEVPLSRFMLAQTNKAALAQISHLAGETAGREAEDHAFTVKLAAFVLSELKTAFQIGCMLFIPFIVIDLVVSSGADGDGHDDAVAARDIAAAQAAAVRAGRRLDAHREHAGHERARMVTGSPRC
jgi:flagellar biosynthetic protein FliP